jgi:alpha-D-xyloside xylohydrolase
MDMIVEKRRALGSLLLSLPLLCALHATAHAADACSPAITRISDSARQLSLTSDCGTTVIEPWGESIVRVLRTPAQPSTPPISSLVVIATQPQIPFNIDRSDAATISVTLPRLRVVVSRSDGRLRFEQPDGKLRLEESAGPPRFTPARWRDLRQVEQSFQSPSGVSYYGLGQQVTGQLNLRGSKIHLQQANRQIVLPMLLSSAGWGLLWDNASVTDVSLGTPTEEGRLIFSSEAAHAIDYYFIAGEDSDEVIRGYRQLTGAAPMLPRWAWGFWQSRERYSSQQELIGIARRYREMQVPLDAVVQDWQYWRAGQWGSHRMDPARFPDPADMLKTLHAMNVHAIISVWPRFDVGTDTQEELQRAGALFPRTYKNVYPAGEGRWYDPFGDGRNLYWKRIGERLGKLGFDGWWLDASEAELGGHWGEMRDVDTAAGPGALVYNAYPLLHTTGVAEGQRRDFPQKRTLILTRSAWAGQQRNSAISWSGDINGDWETFRRQIPAGLNFCASGIPYWNTDIGGFFGGKPDDPGYRELFIRWFQFGAFTPMFRVHGTGAPKEIWRFDREAQDILIRYDKLRYRLLPYIYSTAWSVTSEGATMLRPLVMDFAQDDAALDVPDQFMFGRALLVAPVVRPAATVRTVYLPAGSDWFDFWTGKRLRGGSTVVAEAPLDSLPLFVRAGSLLPLGPVVQHSEEQPNAPIELRIYPGANGRFTFYDDAGDGLAYERGERAIVQIEWNDAQRALTFSDRSGSFRGMSPTRTFNAVCVGERSGVGDQRTSEAQRIDYAGKAQTIRVCSN